MKPLVLVVAMIRPLSTLIFSALALFLTGCAGGYDINDPLYEDPVWKAQAITDLAMDLRYDSRFDFKADPSLPALNERLGALQMIPENLLYSLQTRALQIPWDGI